MKTKTKAKQRKQKLSLMLGFDLQTELAIVTTAPERLLYCLLVSFIVNQYFVARSTTIHNSENGQFLGLNKQLCDVDLALRLSSINGKCLCKMRYYVSAKSAATR